MFGKEKNYFQNLTKSCYNKSYVIAELLMYTKELQYIHKHKRIANVLDSFK